MPEFEHPMSQAQYDRIIRLHDAISRIGDEDLEGDFLDLLGSFAGQEGRDAQRGAEEAVDAYFDEEEGETANDGIVEALQPPQYLPTAGSGF